MLAARLRTAACARSARAGSRSAPPCRAPPCSSTSRPSASSPSPRSAPRLFTAPLFVLLLAALLFRERIGPRRLAAVAAGFAGVLLILRPDPATMGPEALMPLAAGALYGLGNLLTREWCADEPVGALLAAFFAALGLIGAAGSLVLALLPAAGAATFLTAPWAVPSALALGWIAAQAVGSLAAFGLVTRGYQFAATCTLAVFEYSFLISASLWAFVLRGETPRRRRPLGIALIIASGVIVAGASAMRRHPVARSPAARFDKGLWWRSASVLARRHRDKAEDVRTEPVSRPTLRRVNHPRGAYWFSTRPTAAIASRTYRVAWLIRRIWLSTLTYRVPPVGRRRPRLSQASSSSTM